jgi:hypothetical protein
MHVECPHGGEAESGRTVGWPMQSATEHTLWIETGVYRGWPMQPGHTVGWPM